MKVFTYNDKPICDGRLPGQGASMYGIPVSLRHNIKGQKVYGNYLTYLSECYARHYGIAVKPCYIWYTILCEIAVIVKNNPEEFRELFSDSNEKKEIVIPTNDPIQIDDKVLIAEVLEQVPCKFSSDDILLKFSTTTEPALFAFRMAFLDAVSPFYKYSMFLCGFNKIMVMGDISDYQKMISGLEKLIVTFHNRKMTAYFSRCISLMNNIINGFDSKDFWKRIFKPEACGSGHEEDVTGWFSELFVTYPEVAYVQNFSTHISTIDYKELVTKREFTMKSGLLSATINDGCMVPDFEYYIVERVPEATVPKNNISIPEVTMAIETIIIGGREKHDKV